MISHRAEKMGRRGGIAGFVDSLRFHEASRQGLGLLLLPACAWFAQPGSARIITGLALALAGQAWRIFAAGLIYKNSRLATTGPYSLVRHPLYLGNVMILGGFTLAAFHWGVVAAALAFFLFYYPAAVRYEDAKLQRLFGDEWNKWSRAVPAIFPRHLAWSWQSGVHWNARQSLLRNGELPISVYLLACAALLSHRAGLF